MNSQGFRMPIWIYKIWGNSNTADAIAQFANWNDAKRFVDGTELSSLYCGDDFTFSITLLATDPYNGDIYIKRLEGKKGTGCL